MRRSGIGRPVVIAAAVAVAFAVLVGSSPLQASPGLVGRLPVRVLVITMFESEAKPWLEKESLPVTIAVSGAYAPVRCDLRGLCVTTTGQGKSNAAASMAAVLASDRLDFRRAYFLTAGIAGVSPKTGTLGFAAWARWVVDLDLGHHVVPETDLPYGYLPYSDQGTNVFRLNDKLVDRAYALTSSLKLADNAASVESRSHYPGQADQKPYVAVCDTLTGDNYWAGAYLSAKADYIFGIWTKNQGKYCTTQMEDTATATALARRGYLSRYLSLRTASDFDQPYAGLDIQEHLKQFPAFETSVANAYTVGVTVARDLLKS